MKFKYKPTPRQRAGRPLKGPINISIKLTIQHVLINNHLRQNIPDIHNNKAVDPTGRSEKLYVGGTSLELDKPISTLSLFGTDVLKL